MRNDIIKTPQFTLITFGAVSIIFKLILVKYEFKIDTCVCRLVREMLNVFALIVEDGLRSERRYSGRQPQSSTIL